MSDAGYMKRANLQGTPFLLSRVDTLAHINYFNDTRSEASFTRGKWCAHWDGMILCKNMNPTQTPPLVCRSNIWYGLQEPSHKRGAHLSCFARASLSKDVTNWSAFEREHDAITLACS